MRGFLRSGHTPTLVAALLYFDVSFMAWVLLGPLAPFLRADLGLTASEQGLVTAIPLLGGSYAGILREPDTLSLSFLYALTFGGFVDFASFLTTFFHDGYHVSRVDAGDLTTIVVVAGSFLRPVGGWLSDRVGGYRVLVVLLAGVGLCVAFVGTMPSVRVAVGLLFVAMALLGMGNGAVFQLVPQRFPERIGLVTGVVGAAGGLGGFLLPSLLGAIRDQSGSYAIGLMACAVAFLGGVIVLLELGARWSQRWEMTAVQRAGIYSYRAALAGADDESPA